ncbi:cupin domain-containing protein [Deferribacterales bacterium Es71-Z0220]|uniref:phosphate acyltransferase n=1 Tax=Deferrivibrio essentukiensis TaxID=2880922 RepID=UPI001F623FFF|nr:phosphate acyltransferase [Deferrivibrio essentukiensis]MCB4203809.1 cupin domain-containing protein [Deferrivibrio essentukiensis]
MSIGNNIKKVLSEKNITIENLSKFTGIDVYQLSDYINEKSSPSVSDLLKIASCLDTDIYSFIYGQEFEGKKAQKTTPATRVKISRKDAYSYESLAPLYPGKHIEPFIVEIEKKENPEISIHSGEEFHYVLAGKLKITVGEEEFILDEGDSLYFDSSVAHSINSITEKSRILATIYNSSSMSQLTKGSKMRDLIQAAKLLKKQSICLICPDKTSAGACKVAIDENIIDKVVFVGDKKISEALLKDTRINEKKVILVDIPQSDIYETDCARKGVEIIKNKEATLIMKGKINTANFVKAILDKERGIASGRRMSLVSIFEVPNVNRLIFLTDPGINPTLFVENDLNASIEIIKNAIDVAKSMGVTRPKVALLDANEVPSAKLPTTLHEDKLSKMDWEDADVYGPLSYDLALYEEAVKKKGLTDNPVAGKADIIVVPHIEGGNFLYKAWVMTMGAEVANIVLGATVPIILTSRSDSDMTKFLTICASAIYGEYLKSTNN